MLKSGDADLISLALFDFGTTISDGLLLMSACIKSSPDLPGMIVWSYALMQPMG